MKNMNYIKVIDFAFIYVTDVSAFSLANLNCETDVIKRKYSNK